MRRIILALSAPLILLLAYLVLWPVPIDPVAWNPPPAPELTGPLAPNDALVHVSRAFVHTRQGDFAAATADYNAALRLKPDHAQAWADRGYVRTMLGQIDDAIRDLDYALELKPDDFAAHFSRGFAYFNLVIV